MGPAEILERLSEPDRLPTEAIRAAAADRASMVPIFIQAIDQHRPAGASPSEQNALFFMFHLLGDWREKTAYRALARLLRRPHDEIDGILDGCITETTHRVMAAVFDGDPHPLYDIILDPEADEFIRSRMCEAIAMVTLRGELSKAEAARFLRECYSQLDPQDECFVWHGWENAIALLGLIELKPLVAQAFALGYISTSWLRFEHFEEDLRQAIENPGAPPGRRRDEFSLFGDTIEELSTWHCFREEVPTSKVPTSKKNVAPALPLSRPSDGPMINPLRSVGRNDPCPCGSGRKFKKCCLNDRVAANAVPAM
jgi:uncharacterized protein